MAKIKNVKRGDTCILSVTITDGDGAVVDVTGYTAFLTVKAAPSDTSNADDDSTTAVVSMTQAPAEGTPSQGIIQFNIPPATTTSILPGTYYYDVQIKSPTGDIFSSKTDQFIVVADATRRTT